MGETENVEQGASGAVVWDERIKGWYSTDRNNRRSALVHGWHGPSVFYCLHFGREEALAYTEADAKRWVAEGVLP